MNAQFPPKRYSHQATAWQPPLSEHFTTSHWQFPQNDTVFFCDLHADADAFLRSLKASYLISQTSSLGKITLTTQGLSTNIIIGGDCFDKGPSNLKLLSLMGQLRQQGAHLILLAGNHDIRIYAGLLALDHPNDPKQSHFFTRMGRKTSALFAEIFQTYFIDAGLTAKDLSALSNSEIKQALFPATDWAEHFSQQAKNHLTPSEFTKEIRQIAFKQTDFLNACQEKGLNLQQVYWAVHKARELFISAQGDFSWFFQELALLHREGSYLFCHAGLDDRITHWIKTRSIEQVNTHFKTQLQQGDLFNIYYNEFGNVFRTKYRTTDKPLTHKGAATLKSMGIYAIVNGHRSHENGQQLYGRNGLLNFECDTQLNANCRQKSQMTTPGFSATLFYSNGVVSAICSELPHIKMFDPRYLHQRLA
ncbi:metallophosphoesterase [Thiosulfativibrio zosterae]|uniref:Calcineurin-like phosphoesterase domain-containing protein n=1 Tax=Thiosulfativibrio zosterae TaxID=2675053 RepID=A0A6F8PQ47_9GAMM|nr:metallophosphoesterase [Thiosulfativibrio zosterae]BBP44157.1 hypothetical protein THMIRHAT_19030 [Thiosulfativibrio zosterae]